MFNEASSFFLSVKIIRKNQSMIAEQWKFSKHCAALPS